MDSPSADDEPPATAPIPTSKKPDAKQYEHVPAWISNRNNLLKSPYNSNNVRKKYSFNAPSDEEDVVKVFFEYKQNTAATSNNNNNTINTSTSDDGIIPLNMSSFGTATARSMMSSNGSSGWSTPDEAEITPSETSTTSSSSSSSASLSSSSSASPLSPVRSPFRSPLLLQQQPPQSPEMKSESNRTEGQSESVATLIEESNRTEQHSKETTTSTIEESLKMDAEIVSSESLRSTSTSLPSSSLPHIFSSDIESSGTATEKSMLSNEVPSSRTTTLRDTVARLTKQQEQQPNEKDNGDKDEEDDDTGSVVSTSSHHSEASFWGNPVRFVNPFSENEKAEEETSSQNAIMDEADNANDHEPRILELLVQDRPWVFVPTTKSNASEETDVLPDPPAAMDGSLRDTSNTRYRSRQTTDRSDWMPPVSSGTASAAEGFHQHHCDDDTMSVVTATIAETMKRLTQQQLEDQTDNCNSDKINPTTTSDSCAVVEGTMRTGGPSRRIDFAGQTTSHGFSGERNTKKNNSINNESEKNREGQKNQGPTNNHKSSRKSQSKKIRKYYDNGRKVKEKMRCQYMPTAVPSIADPHSDEEGLYDWVPEEVKSQFSSHQGDDDSDDDDDYIDVVDGNDIESDDDDDDEDDEDEDIAIYTDVEANRSTFSSGYGGKHESESSFYDEISIVESDKDHQSRVENDAIGLHSARDDRGNLTAAFPAPPSDTNYASEKPSRIGHYVICLIIVSIPSVVFGIRFFAPR